MKQHVDLEQEVPKPAIAVRAALFDIMPKIARREAPYERLDLRVAFRDVRIGLEGGVSIPVHVDVAVRRLRWECELTLESRYGRAFFPQFSGTLSVSPVSAEACELWLQGTYEVPFGIAGQLVDASAIPDAARNSLRAFLRWLAHEVARDCSLSSEA